METPDIKEKKKVRDAFKSYYVVWKLTPAAIPSAYGFCLNRTM